MQVLYIIRCVFCIRVKWNMYDFKYEIKDSTVKNNVETTNY